MRLLGLVLLLLVALPAVAAANEPPVCRSERVVKGMFGYTAPCSDPDSTTYDDLEIVTPPTHGTARVEFGLIFSYEPIGRPADDTMTIVATDDQGARSEPAQITIAAPWPNPECAGPIPLTVTAGLSAAGLPCWAERLELVTPPQHGRVTFTPSNDSVLPVYDADPDAPAGPDSFVIRAVTPDAVSPEYRYDVTIRPAPAAPTPATPPVLAPAPVIGIRPLTQSRRRIARRGLPLTLKSDVPCAFAVSVTWRGKAVGSATAAGAGRLAVRITKRAVRRAKRLAVTVTATAAGRAPASSTRTVRLR